MDRMRSVEIQARSTDEAVRLALEQLGCTRDQVEIQVLAETEDDIYGEGEVLVRVSTRKGAAPPPRGERPSAPLPPPGDRQPSHSGPFPSQQQQRGGRPGYQQRDNRGQRPGGYQQRRPQPAYQQPPRPPVPPRQPSQATDQQTQELETLAKAVTRELLTQMAINADVIAVDNPSVMPVSAKIRQRSLWTSWAVIWAC